MMRRPRNLAVLTFVIALSLVVATGCGEDDERLIGPGGVPTTATSNGGSRTEVVREVLGQDPDPPGAPGYTLTLVRYTIPPGATLSPHVHPGVQMARIESGELTYHVLEGVAQVQDTSAGGDAAGRGVTAPDTITLTAGQTVIETGDMVHFGANDSGEPVVIVATLLTEDGKDLAVPVTTAPGS